MKQSIRQRTFSSLACGLLSLSLCGSLASAGLSQELSVHEFKRQRLTETYFSEGTAVGDLNGDKIKDIVYGPYWFAGPNFTEKHEIYAPVPQPMEKYTDHFFAWIYDFDGDSHPDIFTVGFPGTPAFVYKNPGLKGVKPGEVKPGEVKHWQKVQVFDWVSNESPQLINLVGDDKPELVCTRDGFFGYASIDWSKPLSTWTFHPISEKVATERFGHGLGIGDVNGDGRMDVLQVEGWFEQPATGADTGRWTFHKVKLSSAYGGAEMYAYDVDGDGDNDVITSEAAHEFGLSWYEHVREGDEINFKQHVIMGQDKSDNKYGVLFSELHSVNLADMDGDGLKDIVTGKTYYSHHKASPMWDAGAVVYWFKLVRGKDGVDWLPYKADGEAGIGRQLIVDDINGDGLLDIATGGMLGSHVLIHSKKTVDEAAYKAAQPKVFDGPKPRAVTDAKRLRGPHSPIDPATGKVAGALEGEALTVKVTGGSASPQGMEGFPGDRWSGKSQLWWTGAKPGDKLTTEFNVDKPLEGFELALTCARDYGVVEIAIDGKPLSEPIDLYEPEVVTTGLLSFKTALPAGKHTLSIEVVGANTKAAKAYMVGVDFIRLRSEGAAVPEVKDGFKATDANGRVLNLDFEKGTLEDWTATGDAFNGQPIQGDTVAVRRSDMRSGHHGQYWIGTFEKSGDKGTGTLTSAPFKVTQRFASFWIAGGAAEGSRIELLAVGEEKPFYQVGGRQTEVLSQVVVDLERVLNKEIQIRLVDQSNNGWGHINFDHFRLHDKRPADLTPASVPLVADEYPHRGLDAAAAAAAMKVPEGFRVTVAAAEPDVKQPIAMALDDRGRTWIAEAYEYPQRAKGDTGRDRILIFEDTNGDGTLDSRKVFAEGLNLVSGLEVGFGGVWVGAAPYLLFIPDANGDDKPDGEPKILLDGWGYQDTHETLNAFIWGPDGWLYGCHGVFTHSNVGKPGAAKEERTPINAGVWRYHPLRHKFEVFAHGTSNPWGVDFNDQGEAFVTACVIPHLFHMIQGGRYHRQAGQHFNANTYDDIKTIADHLHYLGATPHSGNGKSDEAGGGHAHAGAMIYLGGAWPKSYHGALLMNNIHGQRLNVDLLEPEGSGYVGKHAPDFLLTGDMASQILNMRYGPDGQVTMIDWYDMQACHLKEIEKHDRSNGRIYKISYGKSPAVKVDLAKQSDLELAEMCLHQNEWYVRHSRRLLEQRAAAGKIAKPAIERLTTIATTHAEATRRLRAMWALHCAGELSVAVQKKLNADASPVVRGWALRLAMESKAGSTVTPELVQLIEQHAQDKAPEVQLAVASALQQIDAKDRWKALASLAAHEGVAEDHNLPLMIWYAAEPLADVDADRALAWAMVAGAKVPLLRDFMLRRIAGSGGAEAVERLVAGLQKTAEPELQLTFLTAIRNSLAGQRTAKKPAAWDAIYAKLKGSSSDAVKLQATALGVTFGDTSAMSALRAQIADSKLQIADRQSALESLVAAKDAALVDTLLKLVQDSNTAISDLREAAIRGLAQYDDARISETLLAAYSKLSAGERRSAIATLCSRGPSAEALLKAIQAKKIEATDLSADMARQLEYVGGDEVKTLLGQVWGQVRKSSAEKLKQMEAYKQLVSDSKLPKPDESFGRAVYAKTCQRCHTLYGIGQKIGPDLTGSNRANLDYLLENLLDPSAVMANEYRQSILLTDSGQVITGIVRSETDKAVTIQTAEATVVVPKDEIERRTVSEQSMMPDDQLNQFSDHEKRSLIAYLRGKSQVPLKATLENASQFFNGKDLSGWKGNAELWSVVDGEIVGKSSGLKENEFLVSDMTAGDFKLTVEVKLVGNLGNSGIQFRSVARDDGSVEGYQADVGAGWWGKLYEEHGRALLWDKSGESHVRSGEWNTYVIEAVGSKVTTSINGQPCVELDDPKGRREGVFALQLHSGGATEVRFRNPQLVITPAGK
ncbi:MAG: family 16 glycoside hydrolase [Pirellulaceae bacterium]|nr:family 16 glycoside hydrolase [Pirellulaceae bacterium]